jgi:hypothetical protein
MEAQVSYYFDKTLKEFVNMTNKKVIQKLVTDCKCINNDMQFSVFVVKKV